MFSVGPSSQRRYRPPRTFDRILCLALLQKTLNRSQENSRQPVAIVALRAFDLPTDSVGFRKSESHIDRRIRLDTIGLAMAFPRQR